MLISTDFAERQLWVITDYVGGRHGCGNEPDGFWAHSNDRDRLTASQDYTLSVVRHTTADLIEPVSQVLSGVFDDAQSLTVKITFQPFSGYAQLPVLIGDSDSGQLTEKTDI
jgi:hypothetical protein